MMMRARKPRISRIFRPSFTRAALDRAAARPRLTPIGKSIATM